MKKKQKLGMIAIVAMMLVFLSGCVRVKNVNHEEVPYGFIWNYLGHPLEQLMNAIAGLFGGVHAPNAVGFAIMILTLIVRLVLLPLMVSQQHKATIQQEKMGMLRPQLEKLQDLAKNAETQEQRTAASAATMQVYRENNVSLTGGIGCLPLLIQLPIFSGLYGAVRYSPSLSGTEFFGIALKHSSPILAILAFVVYLLQGYLMMLGVPDDQKKMMRTTMLLSPVMILIFSWQTSAALGLYFFVGGVFAVIQTLIINILRPRIKTHVATNFVVKNVADDIIKNIKSQTATPTAGVTPTKPASTTDDNAKRNAGKQNHK
ncbi:membrane protein insertase YidC [Periweissella ghanensis]|uniref:Membrane protein insertase YidC n=1 Tax=Periweissella ghanensis TaxID=467997 RepID=A0ABN8BKH2_9LACO|nr:membrane protein insertase YidC [Periweissella ghanensis]MCM0599991.1 membrane protein insertase YidC [Periweissella ghanensis]CAH0418210.1 Membrane protein insertase YidC [Periweissella ghanensis]